MFRYEGHNRLAKLNFAQLLTNDAVKRLTSILSWSRVVRSPSVGDDVGRVGKDASHLITDGGKEPLHLPLLPLSQRCDWAARNRTSQSASLECDLHHPSGIEGPEPQRTAAMFRILKHLRPSANGGYRRLPTLVLLNGLAEQGESWFHSRPTWQRHFDIQMPGIMVYDGPVMQERIKSGQPITVQFLTERLIEFLDKFVQTPPYTLVASSLGGQIAVEYTASHPEKVGGVVLLCPSGMGCEERLPVTDKARHNDYQGLVESTFHDRTLVPQAVVRYYEAKFSSRAWRKAFFQTVRGTKGHSVRDKLPKMARPTLVICGEQDQIVDPHYVRETVSGLPNFHFKMLPHCGHAPQLEQPRIVNRLVVDFLEKHGSQEPPAAQAPKRAAELIND
jgi:pimeloyl-ACP methyl ester carboxylesterase